MSASARSASTPLLNVVAFLSLLSCGAIFGFFYAWVCSTMWGLDTADPAVAIAAMQAMNASVRNAVFFPAFFLTPVILLIAASMAVASGRRTSALGFIAAALVYLVGAFAATLLVNVPMNEALAVVVIPSDTDEARRIWQAFSGPWQVWNLVRTIASGVALMLCGHAILRLGGEGA